MEREDSGQTPGEGAGTPDPAAVARACELVGDRWSLALVAALLERPLRYTELQEQLPGLAPNILSARLRTLEQDGLIAAERYSARPPRFEFRLTPEGLALRAAALALATWSGAREAEDGSHHEAAHEEEVIVV